MPRFGSDLDLQSVVRIVNLIDAVSAQQPVTLNQLNAAIEGLSWKDDVRVATSSNINLASPGTALDGVTLSVNDRVLVRGQTTAPDNGIYIFNGSGSAMSRSLDMSVSAEFNQAVVPVNSGTDAGTQWRQTAVSPTVGSTNIVFSAFGTSAPSASESTAGIAELATQGEVDTGSDTSRIVTPATLAGWSGRLRKYTTTIGDGSASTFPVTHSLNTYVIHVEVYLTGSTRDTVIVDIQRNSVNQIQVVFASGIVPTSGQYTVVVMG